jgi:hypothetical protein
MRRRIRCLDGFVDERSQAGRRSLALNWSKVGLFEGEMIGHKTIDTHDLKPPSQMNSRHALKSASSLSLTTKTTEHSENGAAREDKQAGRS